MIFDLNGTEWDLSVMRLTYKLSKGTTKRETTEIYLKTINIKPFNTVRSKRSALRNIIYSIFY